jgi:hypothetical protein
MLNLKKAYGCTVHDCIQTRAYIINKKSMNLHDLMETNMSKRVGEHCIYLCILECFLPAVYADGASKLLQRLHMLPLR